MMMMMIMMMMIVMMLKQLACSHTRRTKMHRNYCTRTQEKANPLLGESSSACYSCSSPFAEILTALPSTRMTTLQNYRPFTATAARYAGHTIRYLYYTIPPTYLPV